MRPCIAVTWFLAALTTFVESPSARAETDEIFADSFDGPKWYIDSDGDGFGNPAVFVHSATQPGGYVANALDCNDSDAAIHPGAPDDPDAAFVDSNCDGIDGDIAKAIFVATTGTDVVACGTMANPCHTPAYAISRLDAQHTQIYLQVGSYPGPLSVSANAAFYGGYNAQWHRGPATAAGPNATLIGTSAAMGSLGTQAFAIYAAPGISVLFADIEADAPSTSATADGAGMNSFAFYADQAATLQLLRNRIVQGNGADGTDGTAGVDGTQASISDPAPGGDAAQYSVTCDSTSHGAGAPPSTNTCSSGRSVAAGKGGDGGTMDTSCSLFTSDFTATPGSAGDDAATVSVSAGKGGSGGSGGGTCGSALGGSPGVITDGGGGIGGAGSFLVGGLWIADSGGTGNLGENGGGGGGGGGSGGCDNGTDSYGAGGGGGGAGGCAAVAPGTGGGGGGASFGVFANAAAVTAVNNTFVLGSGGNGGHGGRAGIGQPGGNGGAGGTKASNGGPPGTGGAGGRGGVASGGGGGQGGSVFGLYSYSSTVSQSGNTFSAGVAGSGGAGGTSSVGPGAGQNGGDGFVGDVGSCVTPGSCN
jgi:hypothetical protein